MQVHQQREERARLQRLIDRGNFGSPLSPEEHSTLLGLWRTAQHHPANSTIAVIGGIRLISSGWAGWLRRTPDGRRLIFLFLLPGDFIIPGLVGPECDLVSLMPVRTVDAACLMDEGGAAAPRSFHMIQQSGTRYRHLLLDHLTRLLVGSTTSSLALLLTELHDRSLHSGACDAGRFHLPIGQRLLAAALGRSAVQINKVIRRFQADGLVRVGYDWLEVVDLAGLRALTGIRNGDAHFVLPDDAKLTDSEEEALPPANIRHLIIG